MGKGDIKSKRGKIANGSYGNSRKRKEVKQATETTTAKPAEKKTEKKK